MSHFSTQQSHCDHRDGHHGNQGRSIILKHHGIPICIVGDLVLNYYNVPRVCHDIEICVPKSALKSAPEHLCSTGLFRMVPAAGDFNNYTEYKRGFPIIQTTGWTVAPQKLVVFPATHFGLEPLESALARASTEPEIHLSKEIRDVALDDINQLAQLPLPRLAPLIKGLATRYLESGDDMAMVAVEQLVDGMDLDDAWLSRHTAGSSASLVNLLTAQVRGKKDRIDYFSENKITCFVRDEEEAALVRLIPGFD